MAARLASKLDLQAQNMLKNLANNSVEGPPSKLGSLPSVAALQFKCETSL
jgi:hypothetical protein